MRRVEDNSGCEHRVLVGPKRVEEHIGYGSCQECGREVAIELDKNSQRTGRTWLVEYEPSVQFMQRTKSSGKSKVPSN
jgi:hypothetical protein